MDLNQNVSTKVKKPAKVSFQPGDLPKRQPNINAKEPEDKPKLNRQRLKTIKINANQISTLSNIKKQELNHIEIYFSIVEHGNFDLLAPKQQPAQYWKIRQKTLNFINKFCDSFNWGNNTFYTGIVYLDSLMHRPENETWTEKDIYLNALNCAILSSKYIENDSITIHFSDALKVLKKYKFTKEEILNNELKILEAFEYNWNSSSVYDFIKAMITIGIIYNEDLAWVGKSVFNKLNTYIKDSMFTVVNSMISWKYPNEVIAMSIIKEARSFFELNKNKMSTIIKKFGFEYDNELFNGCYDEVEELLHNEKSFSMSDEDDDWGDDDKQDDGDSPEKKEVSSDEDKNEREKDGIKSCVLNVNIKGGVNTSICSRAEDKGNESCGDHDVKNVVDGFSFEEKMCQNQMNQVTSLIAAPLGDRNMIWTYPLIQNRLSHSSKVEHSTTKTKTSSTVWKNILFKRSNLSLTAPKSNYSFLEKISNQVFLTEILLHKE